jgi:hypothetical protein
MRCPPTLIPLSSAMCVVDAGGVEWVVEAGLALTGAVAGAGGRCDERVEGECDTPVKYLSP